MLLYKCDRCHKILDSYAKKRDFMFDDENGDRQSLNLCVDCMKLLKQFIEGNK